MLHKFNVSFYPAWIWKAGPKRYWAINDIIFCRTASNLDFKMICTWIFPLSYVEDCITRIFYVYSPVCLWREKCKMVKWWSPNYYKYAALSNRRWRHLLDFSSVSLDRFFLWMDRDMKNMISKFKTHWFEKVKVWCKNLLIWRKYKFDVKTHRFEKNGKFDVKTCWFEEVKVWCINLLIGKKVKVWCKNSLIWRK